MRKLATLTVVIATLALPAAALAKNIKQSGFVTGDKAATVKLRVNVKGGEPVKVGGFRAQNVLAHCKKPDRDIRITLTALEPVPVKRSGDFKVRLGDGAGGYLEIKGEVLDDGRSTKGSIKTNDFKKGDDTCRVTKQRFKTSVR